MSTILTHDLRLAPAANPVASKPLARVWAIARGEVKLFLRNRTVLLTAVLLGPAMAAAIGFLNSDMAGTPAFTMLVVNLVFTWGVLLAVYYNLTSIFVARREEKVFKRLVTGEATHGEVVAGAATPSVLVFLAQVVLTAIISMIFFAMPTWDNPLLVVVSLVLSVVVFVGLAAFSTSFTSSSEAAQFSTMPLLMVFIFFSGSNFPLSFLPEPLQVFASYTPLYAASELLMLGMGGATIPGEVHAGFTNSLTAAAQPAAVLAAWAVVSVYLARRYMQFEPRR